MVDSTSNPSQPARKRRPIPPPPRDFASAPEWLRRDHAAHLSGTSVRTIDRWVNVGYIRASKPASGRKLISRDSLRHFIEAAAE